MDNFYNSDFISIDSFKQSDSFCLLDNEKNPINQNPDFCNTCEPLFIMCDLCSGYFDLNTFYEEHENKCRLIYQIYQDKESLVECQDCKSFVKYDQFKLHKNNCVKNQRVIQAECSYCKLKFSLRLIEEHEKTCQMILSEMMLIQETIECDFCKEKVALGHIQSHEKKCQKLIEKQKLVENQIKQMKVEYPSEWTQDAHQSEIIDDNLSVVTINNSSVEYKIATDLMKLSIPNVLNISKVKRIQNNYLWEKYYREKAKVKEEKGECEEKWLFHGTRNNNPKSLYTIGFDISFASDSGAFGRGIYFARQSLYSYQGYCYIAQGKGYMFLAKVITGQTYVSDGRRNINQKSQAGVMIKPPLWDESKFIYYDSVSNIRNTKNDHTSQMFIVYENDKAYPFYLIEFDASAYIINNPFINPRVVVPIAPNKYNKKYQKPIKK